MVCNLKTRKYFQAKVTYLLEDAINQFFLSINITRASYSFTLYQKSDKGEVWTLPGETWNINYERHFKNENLYMCESTKF